MTLRAAEVNLKNAVWDLRHDGPHGPKGKKAIKRQIGKVQRQINRLVERAG